MTDQLRAIRRKIDRLDTRVANLLAQRFALAIPLAGLKKKAADPAREKRVLANAAAGAGKPAFRRAVRAVFAEIILQSKNLQSAYKP